MKFNFLCIILLMLVLSCDRDTDVSNLLCESDLVVPLEIIIDLQDYVFYSPDNADWYRINEHEGQDTYCYFDAERNIVGIKSCFYQFCGEEVFLDVDDYCGSYFEDAIIPNRKYCESERAIIAFEPPNVGDCDYFKAVFEVLPHSYGGGL
ncbi:MAG: hypothetical protein AAGI23_08215 [Bacteroidota bacterium]